MKIFKILLIVSTIFYFFSCSSKEGEKLKQSVKQEYSVSQIKTLSQGGKVQYIEMEKKLNRQYIDQLKSIIDDNFENQLENFEDNELGVMRSYANMFSWLFKSKESWNDEMNLMSKKYFNPLDGQQKEHEAFLKYQKMIKELRMQFAKKTNLPQYSQIDLPQEDVSLNSFSEHTRNNIAIEIGTEIFGWLLGFMIAFVILLFIDKIAGPLGCVIDIVVLLIIIVVSIIMTSFNDDKLLEGLQKQHQQEVTFDYDGLLNSLDVNTIKFYEKI